MSDVKIAKLQATCSLGNGIECVDINISVNSAATATLQLGQETQDVVVEPLAAEVLKQIKDMQTARLAGVTEPTLSLYVNDDVYGKFDMKGFLASPMLEISDGNIGFQVNVLDKASMLDGLDLSIYDSPNAGYRQAERAQDFPKPTGDVCKLLSEWTDKLVGNYDTAYKFESDPVKKSIIQMRHTLNNSGPLKIWRKILEDSRVTHRTWQDLITDHPAGGRHISDKARSMLCTKSSGFWNVVNMLMSGFQMYYKPEPNGEGYGKFCKNSDKAENPRGSLTLDIINLNVRDGSSRILQVGGVVIEGGGSTRYRSGERGTPGGSCAGVYPDPIKTGYIHSDVAPIWLVDASGVPILGSSIDTEKSKAPGSEAPNLNIGEYKERLKEGETHVDKIEVKRSSIMTEVCEQIFKDMQLQDSVLSARVPLNLTINVGERKNIQLGDSGSVTGFVQAIRHSIDLRQGRELDSFSQITITHVEY